MARWPLLALTILTAVLGIVAITTMGRDGHSPQASALAQDSARPAPVIGDQHSADPCALARPAQQGLVQFGKVELDSHYGNFNRCDLVIHSADGSAEVDVVFQLLKASPPIDGIATKIGSVTVTKESLNGNECDRDLSLVEPSVVNVFARMQGGQADLCRIADTASDAAVSVLNQGILLPRRPVITEKSLVDVDTCTLLDASRLASVGVDGSAPEPEYGSWECDWGSTGSRSATVRFDQGPPLVAPKDGRPIKLGRWNAFVQPDGDDDGNNCLVSIEYRNFSGNGRDKIEAVQVVLGGPRPPVLPETLCSPATRLAATVATNLQG